jgi:hypothetical protein
MTGYYDIVLGLIPITLLGISGVLVGFGLDLTTAVPLASVVAVGVIGHSLFVNGPVSDATEDTTNPRQSTQYQAGD